MRKTHRPRHLVASVVIIGLGLVAPVTRAESTTVKIVSSLPMKGASGPEAASIDHAIRLALEERDSRAGGFLVEYQALDDTTPGTGAWDAHREAKVAHQAVGDPDVMAYIGPFSSAAARTVLPMLNRAHLVAVSPIASDPGLTKAAAESAPDEPGISFPSGVRSFARIIPPDDQQAVVGAAWSSQPGANRVAVVDDGSLRGRRLSAAFIGAARRLGMEVVSGPHSVDPHASDYRGLAEQIRGSGPELVYFAGGGQNHAGQVTRDVRAPVGPSVAIMATDRVYSQRFLDEAGSEGDRLYVLVNGLPPSN